MAERKVKYLISESESMIMEYLWKQEEGKTFGDITEYLNTTCQKDWKRQTINTFIKRLTEKGLLVSQNTVKKRVYYPAMNYTEYKQGEAKDFLGEFYGGSVKTFLSAFSGGGKLDEETANELKEMLEEM
ncbi:MAG: BlaI/MecI/CopY family transcriptional regulator [Lachnospiraceae bacterium]|jgi:predicted transcriptional regulator|nr:BlaI/MecI/CopY family transcriptional regulator [Lachnospiraceae bacterium]